MLNCCFYLFSNIGGNIRTDLTIFRLCGRRFGSESAYAKAVTQATCSQLNLCCIYWIYHLPTKKSL